MAEVLNLSLFPESQPDDWYTPGWLFEQLAAEFGPFTLDAAASPTNAKCEEYFTRDDDGLQQPWRGRVWCNPPYKDLIHWVRKGYEEVASGRCEMVCFLLTAQTSTDWFHDYALRYGVLRWIRRKVKFGGRSSRAYMPSVAVVFTPESIAREFLSSPMGVV